MLSQSWKAPASLNFQSMPANLVLFEGAVSTATFLLPQIGLYFGEDGGVRASVRSIYSLVYKLGALRIEEIRL